MKYSNTYPDMAYDVSIEPYLYTAGDEYKNIENLPYEGYYYNDNIGGIDRVIAGKNALDGTYDNRKVPTTDRYLTLIDNTT